MYLTRLICFAHDLVLGIPLPSLVEVAIRRERERERERERDGKGRVS